MKVILFGGRGHIGSALRRHLDPDRYRLTVVTRSPNGANEIGWDGKTLGDWVEVVNGADVVINLAGRRVHCRYNESNLQEMMDSRLDSTRLVGQAIASVKDPPKVWLQAGTATIYAHTFDHANDELAGTMGGSEPGVPSVWNYSVSIAKNWERCLDEADTPSTRKIAMRTSIMMGIDKDSAFDVFSRLTRLGLGGKSGSGRQYVSWIHELDLARAIEFMIERSDLSGPINLCAPDPLPQVEFAKELRKAWDVPLGLPATPWMVAIGAWAMNGDSELVMKSRRVVPARLLEAGFEFRYPSWSEAAKDLVKQMQSARLA